MAPQLRIAVIGTGDVGSTLIELLVTAGHDVVVGSRRAPRELPESLRALVRSGHVRLEPVERSLDRSEVVFLAVPWHAAIATVEQARFEDGAVVVDTTNFNAGRDGVEHDPGIGGTTDVLARRFPQLRWIKSFNMLWTGFLREDADRGDPHRVVLVAGDDQEAKTSVAELIRDMGFVPFDNGRLADARERQLENTPAWNRRLSVDEAQHLLPTAPGVVLKQ